MEIKKSPKANLQNKKLLFMEIGLIVALLIVLGAFEWSTTETSVSILEEETAVVIEEEQVPITQEEQLPPPEVPKEPVMSDVIDIVDDDIKVDDDFLISTEDDASLGVEIKDYVVEQVEEEEVEEEIPFAIVEQKPTFQGKDANAFTKWVFSKIVYPEIAKENGVQGRVTLQFTIDTDGSVTNVKVLRGVDSSLDKEAVRVVSSSPKWKPGMQRNKPVKVKYTFPVVFNLR
ncbi:MAG: energy transducer TonB [Bacteroidales bacterium]|nr:energy transducer TonB [Bacteroidales bacterium]MBR1949351.1 energy transducer TonB [Bacteroidales bacterium]MBR4088585.1 energy transducer TonB [Bacteroidales bacterium]